MALGFFRVGSKRLHRQQSSIDSTTIVPATPSSPSLIDTQEILSSGSVSRKTSLITQNSGDGLLDVLSIRSGGEHSIAVLDATLALGTMELGLNKLCNLIDAHKSFSTVQIVASSTYVEKTWKRPHRFILLRLRRTDANDIWIRIDRRHITGGILKGAGSHRVNEKVVIAATLDEVIDFNYFKKENELVFDDCPTTMGDLGLFLRVVADELVKYTIWPENCWIFCSLLQEHLGWGGVGVLTEGKLLHTDVAFDYRVGIKQRVQQMYHMPAAFTTQAVLRAFAEDHRLSSAQKTDFRAALNLADQSPEGVLHHSHRPIVDRLNAAAGVFEKEGFIPEAAAIWCQSVRILRSLMKVAPRENRALLSHCTQHYADLLEQLGRIGEAVDMHKSAVLMKRRQFDLEPDAHRLQLIPLVVSHGELLLRAGRVDKACDQFAYAVRLTQPLLTDPATVPSARGDLAIRLSTLGNALVRLGEIEEACKVFEDAVFHQGELHRSDPLEHGAELARYYTTLATTLSQAGHDERAADAYEQAVTLTRPLQRANQAGSAEHLELIRLLWEHQLILQKLSRYEDVEEALDEVVVLQRSLAHLDPSRWQPDLRRYRRYRDEFRSMNTTSPVRGDTPIVSRPVPMGPRTPAVKDIREERRL